MEEASPLLRNGIVQFQKSMWELLAEETEKVAYIATPTVVVTVSQHLLRIESMMMVGHLGELALSGAAIATSITKVSGLGLLLGMASALETLFGQAFGAEQYQKLGNYTYAAVISPHYLYTNFHFVNFRGQITNIYGTRCFNLRRSWQICNLDDSNVVSLCDSSVRYLQTQSLILPMVLSSIAGLLFHVRTSLWGFNVQGQLWKCWSSIGY